jgi:hypothetical protein
MLASLTGIGLPAIVEDFGEWCGKLKQPFLFSMSLNKNGWKNGAQGGENTGAKIGVKTLVQNLKEYQFYICGSSEPINHWTYKISSWFSGLNIPGVCNALLQAAGFLESFSTIPSILPFKNCRSLMTILWKQDFSAKSISILVNDFLALHRRLTNN